VGEFFNDDNLDSFQ
jgi:hypothetical protein